jgi:hypothetical protein
MFLWRIFFLNMILSRKHLEVILVKKKVEKKKILNKFIILYCLNISAFSCKKMLFMEYCCEN